MYMCVPCTYVDTYEDSLWELVLLTVWVTENELGLSGLYSKHFYRLSHLGKPNHL